ncbi:MAG: hypothetical protein K8I00_02190, partial [Candidatus Omnitrophica bacterium]|nr:hypothetical protein [Candidatus Omnitrophota bacterium]
GRVMFFAGVQSQDRIDFVRPDGRILLADDNAVTLYRFTYMLIGFVNEPMPGEWAVRINGRGKFLVTVRR